MDHLSFSLSVALIGILVVFTGLVILIFCMKGISLLANTGTKKEKKEKPIAPVAAPTPIAAPVVEAGIPADVIAAITAAICVVMDGASGGFTVKHVRRISNAPAWNRAGREEQTYSRF
ncbi:MAG: OadG family protein [Eubacteriales bacterium]|nr:OadG family protein [Eubacteriales bacterium]